MARIWSGPFRLSAVIALILLSSASLASAIVVGGGGASSSDCLLALDAPVNQPESKPRNYRCTDGDPCDADGLINGVCAFPLKVCANSTYNPESCTLAGVDEITVDHAEDNGDEKFDPDFQALQQRIDNDIAPPNNDPDACTSSATTIRIPIEGPFLTGFGNVCKKRVKKMKIVSTGIIGGKVYKDTDKIKMTCDPAPNPPNPAGCDPMAFWPSGTFERIQRQIFDQSCAVSGCHDSQSMTGGLLLESGASYGNLVEVAPNNFAAYDAGWRRVDIDDMDPMVGHPETSFIFHKLTGDLEHEMGGRMPFERRKLDQSLIDVIERWIAAGAPSTGWVPGTF